MERKKLLWVDKDFSKLIKRQATDNEMSILGYTKKIAEEQSLFDINPPSDNKKKKRGLIL